MDGNSTEDQNFKDSLFPMRTRGPTGEIVMRGDPFSQAEELSKEKDLRKNKGGHNGEKMYTLFTLRSATPDKFDPKQADIMCAVYDKSQGFITPFHTQLWSESWTGPSKENFAVPWDISTGDGQTRNLQLRSCKMTNTFV